jgi:hypothetical protein
MVTRDAVAAPLCLRHREDPAAAICQRCGEGLCDVCWTFSIADKPLCPLCVRDVEWRPKVVWSRFAVFFLTAVGLAFWLSRHVPSDVALGAWAAVAVAALFGVFAATRRARRATGEAERIARRIPGAAAGGDPLQRAAHPYRARFARVAAGSARAVSARTMAFVVGLSLVASGVLVPIALKLPRWVEFEVVVAAWWTILFGLLAVLLHRGARLREDYAFRLRWNLPDLADMPDGGDAEALIPKTNRRWGWLESSADGAGCTEVEGCAGIVVGAVLSAVAVAAAWLVIELAFPAVFFLLYWLVVKAIARVANDRHGCEQNVGRSIAYGALWATVYTSPIAAVVWIVHRILAAKIHG